ncbi:AarF/UbiB family protein [Leptothoe sp. ISB3NOV94-8A]
MLKKSQCTTPLLQPSEKKALQEVPVSKPQFWRIFFILGRLLLLVLNFLRDIVLQGSEEGRAAKVREFLELLGGMWIKVGQIFAMRTDLFSLEFCRELAKLQDRAMIFSPQLSMEIIEAQLGTSIDEVFDDFELEPFAAASLSQVHKARRKQAGNWVVIKVQRPYAAEYFQYDFNLLNLAFNLLGQFKALQYLRLDEMLQEIQASMEEELDYRLEASNMLRLKQTLTDHGIYVPDVYLEFNTDRVLVMEFIDGVFVSDFNSVLRDDPKRVKHWLAENNIDPCKVAQELLQSAFRQLYEDLLFHGDLHSGNIILLRNSKLALIDFGSVGRLDPKFAAQYDQYFRAMAEGAFDKAAELLLLTMGQLPPIDLVKVKRRIVRVLNKQAARSMIKNLPYYEKSIGSSSAELGQIMAEFKIGVNWQYLRMRRTFDTLDQNISILNPGFDFVAEIQMYLEGKFRRMKCKQIQQPPDMMQRINDLYELLTPALTRRAFEFEGEVSLESRLAAMVLQSITLAMWLVLIFCFGIYLYQYHYSIVGNLHLTSNWFTHWLDSIPPIHPYAWYLLGSVMIVIIFRTSRFASSLLEPVVPLPRD